MRLLSTLTHAELLQRVWVRTKSASPGWYGDMVSKLRRKMGDDAADPRFIVTEPRVGYRMATGEGT